ncbi:glycosyltransferase family 2 protein [Rhodococcus sp. 077-4]|uniref:glycosyltransferase family 2 protein n=1 Tax=Rhodococcus sp. 077-4 TaxID=2789271 RepID=UPI0039F530D6
MCAENRPALTIITINFNNSAGLAVTLNSFVSQQPSPIGIELLIIDGGSTDESAAVARQYDEYDGIKWFSEPDNGVYDAMNKGIARGNGDFYLFLNSGDSFAVPTALKVVHSGLASNPVWMIVGARNLGGGRRAPSIIRNIPHNWIKHAYGLQPHCHQACLFRRDLVSSLGGYSEQFQFVGDFDFILRAGAVAAPLEIDELLINYEGGGLSENLSDQIPALLHDVRASCFDLAGGVEAADRVWARAQQVRRRLSRRKNAVVERIGSRGQIEHL